MSDKTKPIIPAGLTHFAVSFVLGAAAAGGCLCALAAFMANRGLAPELAQPLAAVSLGIGSLFGGWLFALLQKQHGLFCGAAQGTAFAALLLLAQGAAGSVPGGERLLKMGLVALAGAMGGVLRAWTQGKRHRA